MPEEIDVPVSTEPGFDSDFDYTPLAKGFFQRAEERLFRLVGGKKVKKEKVAQNPVLTVTRETPVNPITGNILNHKIAWPVFGKATPKAGDDSHDIEQASFNKPFKTKFQLPALPAKANVLVTTFALCVFVAGAYILYAELPTRPELVIGILLVSVAGNLIISR